MTTVAAVGAGLMAAGVLRQRRIPHGKALSLLGVVLVLAPPLALLALGATGLALVVRRRRSRRGRAAAAEEDIVLLADLLALGLGAGLGLPAALDEAAAGLGGGLAAELTAVRRSMEQAGAEIGLAGATGRAEHLYRLLGRAAATGAPLMGAVEAFAAERRHEDHARRLEAARRLPVRLLLPLALLILPGFVVLAVGPALLEALSRLQVSL